MPVKKILNTIVLHITILVRYSSMEVSNKKPKEVLGLCSVVDRLVVAHLVQSCLCSAKAVNEFLP